MSVRKAYQLRRNEAILCAVVALAGTGVFIALRMLPAAMITAGVAYVLLLFFWMTKVVPWRRYNKYMKDMASGQRHTSEGEFVSVSSDTRVCDGVDVYDFLLSADADADAPARLFYWDANKPLPPLQAGQRLMISSYGHFIVRLEHE